MVLINAHLFIALQNCDFRTTPNESCDPHMIVMCAREYNVCVCVWLATYW